MNLYEDMKKLFKRDFDKKTRIILMIVYALVMFTAIQSQLNTITFILLFAVVPIAIYIFVKKIFPN